MRASMLQTGFRAALVGAVLLTAAGEASARNGRNAALFGGVALGALGGVALGAALAAPPRPRPVYVGEPVYVAPRHVGPICHYERRKVWLDDEAFTYRRVEVCE